jgi:hypothetical protein
MVLVRTQGGEEQGVATPYGVIFLGRTAQSGRCDVTVYFGDGPSLEPGTIDTVDPELCIAQLEVKVPMSEVSFTYPDASDSLYIGLITPDGPELYSTTLATDLGVRGTALRIPGSFPISPSVAGAPVFRFEDKRYRLVGLVNGVARFKDSDGDYHEILTFLGPRNLALVAIKDKDRGRPKDPPLRTDILR